MRYQIQDTRCKKTNRVSTNTLAKVSACGAELRLDIQTRDAERDVRILQDLAKKHNLEELLQVTTGVLGAFA